MTLLENVLESLAMDLTFTLEARHSASLHLDLDHSNMVVIDCDSEVSVNYFKGLADVTEAWISPKGDSMHLVFKADSIYNTKISHKASVDFLGNNDTRLRALKPNKKCNGTEFTHLRFAPAGSR